MRIWQRQSVALRIPEAGRRRHQCQMLGPKARPSTGRVRCLCKTRLGFIENGNLQKEKLIKNQKKNRGKYKTAGANDKWPRDFTLQIELN